MHSGCVRARAGEDEKTRSRPSYRMGYQLLADTVVWLEGKSVGTLSDIS